MRSLSGWLGSLSRSSTSSTPAMATRRVVTMLEESQIVDLVHFEQLLHGGREDSKAITNAFLSGQMPAVGLADKRPLVFRAKERKSGLKAIVKVIHKSQTLAEDRERLDNLFEKLLSLPYHPLLLTFYGVYEDAERWYIISEALEGPELFHFLLREDTLPEELCKHIIRQILLALEYLHSNNLTHRDVKPENLVFRYRAQNVSWPGTALNASGKDIAHRQIGDYLTRFELVLIDLDTAQSVQESSTILMQNGRPRRRVVGTYNYMAPEVLEGVANCPTSDMWGVGVILYILMTGALPLPMMQMTSIQSSIATHLQIRRAGGINFNAYPLNAFPGARSLCEQLLQSEPHLRLRTATAALMHPWLASSASISEVYYAASNVVPRTIDGYMPLRSCICASRMVPPHLSPHSLFTMPAALPHNQRGRIPTAQHAFRSPTTPKRKSRRYKEISALSTAAHDESECL